MQAACGWFCGNIAAKKSQKRACEKNDIELCNARGCEWPGPNSRWDPSIITPLLASFQMKVAERSSRLQPSFDITRSRMLAYLETDGKGAQKTSAGQMSVERTTTSSSPG